MSELPDGIAPAEPSEPRDSASGIVLRRGADGGWEALLGVRSRRSRFMPGHLAFPGGMVDPEDRTGPGDPFVRCVRREMLEETGVDIDVRRWSEAGVRVTPPLFPRRFRTAFFLAPWPEDAAPPAPATEELESLAFMRPHHVVRDWERGSRRVPPPTLPILRALSGDVASLSELADRVATANLGEERAPRIEFAPGIWMIPVRTATLPPATHTNVWMPGRQEFAVVDPGSTEPEEHRRLQDVVARRRALGHRPSTVVLTHEHRDHVGGAAAIARALGLPVRAHPTTLEALGGMLEGCRQLQIADGEDLKLGDTVLTAHHTPGHARGHLVLHDADSGTLVAGDLVSGVSTILIDPVGGSMADYLDSLRRTGKLRPRLLCPGHGPPLPGRAIEQLLEHRAERERTILGQLDSSVTGLDRLARVAYAGVPQMPLPLIERQTLSHLIHLESRGLARRADSEGRSWTAGSASTEGDVR